MARPWFLLTRQDGRHIAFIEGRDRLVSLSPAVVEIDGTQYEVKESAEQIEQMVKDAS